jgi:hypothetical protein
MEIGFDKGNGAANVDDAQRRGGHVCRLSAAATTSAIASHVVDGPGVELGGLGGGLFHGSPHFFLNSAS